VIAVLLLAAGASSRMRGRDKLTERIDGESLLRRMSNRAIASDLGPVVVTLPDPDHPRVAEVDGLKLRPVYVPDAAEGMAASIRAGVAALPPETQAVIILPADMPDLTAQDLQTLAHARRPGVILRGASGQRPGHPVLFPAEFFGALRHLRGDQGARPVIAAHAERSELVPLPGEHALTDLDTPEAWDSWRAARTPRG
tara:strand:+ start:16472 stop:17065 length:594 start_codon:yes stop_codon:yes gene_type:complete